MDSALRNKIDSLPASPGVYVFRDRSGGMLYVGKAANLRARVRSYFQRSPADGRYFIGRLHGELGDLQTFVTATEKEAALLESGLIRQHQPRYNVKLRDDKDFLSLRLDPAHPWPRLEAVRRPKKDGARYFGPYHTAAAARSTLRLVNRFFRLRTCTDREFRSRVRACLQYQIKRCPAPCVYDVDRDEYADQVKNVTLFLEGCHDELLQLLKQQMDRASGSLDYELAAVYRDQIRAVQSSRQPQRVSLVTDVDQDVFGFYRQQDKAEFAVLLARRGRVVAVRTYELRQVRIPDDEMVGSFVSEYYQRGSFVPDEVLLPLSIEARQGVSDLLSEQRGAGAGVRLIRPQRGKKAQLLRMAMENAVHAFQEKARALEDLQTRLSQIQKRLSLTKLPRRIESVDVSHIAGADTVAAVVAFYDGEPDKKRYRSFHLRSTARGDDYGAIFEVLRRRFARSRAGNRSTVWELPDLVVVDGGKGQLSMALKALKELEIDDLPVVALAKERDSPTGETMLDRIYLPGRKNPVVLRDGRSNPFHLLLLARDEAHRACNNLRLKLGKRRRLRSGLEDIAGVGPKTRASLLRNLGSVRAVRLASTDELVAAGANRRQAEAIRAALQGGEEINHGGGERERAAAEQAAVDNAFSD